MDVGNPSNFERLVNLFPSYDLFSKNITSNSVNNDKIKETILKLFNEEKLIVCPHTATAFYARKKLNQNPWIVVSTADPCKFDDIIEPIISTKVPIADELNAMLNKKAKIIDINSRLSDIKEAFIYRLNL